MVGFKQASDQTCVHRVGDESDFKRWMILNGGNLEVFVISLRVLSAQFGVVIPNSFRFTVVFISVQVLGCQS